MSENAEVELFSTSESIHLLDDTSIRDAIELIFPESKNKWDKWEKSLHEQDLDNVRDIKILPPEVFNRLYHTLSVSLVLGLRQLREHDEEFDSNQNQHTIAVPLLFMSMIGVVFVLYAGAEILVPFTISLFFVYLLRPFYLFVITPFRECFCCRAHRHMKRSLSNEQFTEDRSLLTRDGRGGHAYQYSTQKGFCITRVPIFLAVCMALALGIGAAMLIVGIAVDNIQTFEKGHLRAYEDSAIEMAESLSLWTNRTFGIDASTILTRLKEESQSQYGLSDLVQMTAGIVTQSVSLMSFIMLFVLYLLPEQSQATNELSLKAKIDSQIQRYILLKSLISALAAMAVYIILDIFLNIPMSFLFACVTFVFNFIPNLGAIIASMLPLPIIILDPDLNSFQKFLAFGLPISVHLVVGNFLEPLIFGDRLELHPIVVLLSLAFWYAMWGVPGAILSVPITACLRIIFSHVRHPYAVFMLNLLEGKLFDTLEPDHNKAF